jgi:hypothetical protein
MVATFDQNLHRLQKQVQDAKADFDREKEKARQKKQAAEAVCNILAWQDKFKEVCQLFSKK